MPGGIDDDEDDALDSITLEEALNTDVTFDPFEDFDLNSVGSSTISTNDNSNNDFDFKSKNNFPVSYDTSFSFEQENNEVHDLFNLKQVSEALEKKEEVSSREKEKELRNVNIQNKIRELQKYDSDFSDTSLESEVKETKEIEK
eukprot:Pgem_evm1s371